MKDQAKTLWSSITPLVGETYVEKYGPLFAFLCASLLALVSVLGEDVPAWLDRASVLVAALLAYYVRSQAEEVKV